MPLHRAQICKEREVRVMPNEQLVVVAEPFIPLERITEKVIRLLYVNIGTGVFGLIISAFSALMAWQGKGNIEDTEFGLWFMLAFCVLSLIIWSVTVVQFCKWMYRAYKNLLWFGVQNLHGTPARAVCSWFIPFANLVWPYRYMRDIWQNSDVRSSALPSNKEELPRAFGWWWGVWWLQCFIGFLSIWISFKAGDKPSLGANVLDMLAGVFYVIAALLLIRIVNGITERQEHKNHAMTKVANT